jgi:hypothetical protein
MSDDPKLARRGGPWTRQLALPILLAAALLAACGGESSAPATQTEFWVSPQGDDAAAGTRDAPFLTLQRARDAVRALDAGARERDVSVFLRGGMHRLQRTLVLDARDSGRAGHPVVYRAAPGEQPVIAGSIPVTGWTLVDAELGIYQTYVGPRETRQLYVNGQRATRARTPDYPVGFRPTYYWFFGAPTPVGIEFIPTELNDARWRDPARWSNPQRVEAVIRTQWKMMVVPLQGVTPYPGFTPDPVLAPNQKTGLLTMQEPGWTNANLFLANQTLQPGLWSFWQVSGFENAYEFLDAPGEWYLNSATGMLYYIPRPGEDIASAQVELPVLETLVDGQGSLEAPLTQLRFEGLAFTYATWLRPGSPDGYVADQSGFHLVGEGHAPNLIGHDPDVVRTPGNLRFRYAQDLIVRANRFQHLGGVALDFDTGSQRNRIEDNLFEDISSAAVQLGGVAAADHHPTHPAQYAQDNVVHNNLIRQTGRDFVDSAAIYVGFTRRTRISQNTIREVPWSGIAMGWGWGLLDQGMFPGLPNATRGMWGTYLTPTPDSGNRIVNNLIENFLGLAWDGGAIYTTGQQGLSMADALLIEGNVARGKRPAATRFIPTVAAATSGCATTSRSTTRKA